MHPHAPAFSTHMFMQNRKQIFCGLKKNKLWVIITNLAEICDNLNYDLKVACA